MNAADTAFRDRLATALPADTLRAPDARYLAEPRGRFTGQQGILALPRDVQQVATLIRLAAEAVVPRE